jgi:hypothetical protein
MPFSVWLDFDKPLTSLAYPPGGKRVSKSLIPLGNLPGVYYEVGEQTSKPLLFPTKSEAQKVADLIKNSVIQKEENL